MDLSAEDLRVAARDARLELTLEEQERLHLIIDGYGQKIQRDRQAMGELPGGPLTYPRPLENVFRSDTPGVSLPRETALANGPVTDTSCFFVPKIVED